jgi:3-oxoacyl-[acyl-carrier-protein] synthase-1
VTRQNEKRIFLSAPGIISCAGNNAEDLYKTCVEGRLPDTGKAKCVAYDGDNKIWFLIQSALEQIRGDVERAAARYGKNRIGLCLGSCDNGSEASLKAHKAFYAADGAAARSFPPGFSLKEQSAAFPAEKAAACLGIAGPAFAVATACASGASALIRGAELIRSGACDAAVAGGADIVSPTVIEGFASLEALSDSQTNPFSKNRKGINLGDGAAFFLLSADSADCGAEGKPAELLGYGESADAFHITSPDRDGEGAALAMASALRRAGLEPEQIAYVNLHGTGTEQNDRAEALAMKSVFGEKQPYCGSTKPVTGHTLGAAGAIEAALCRMVLADEKRRLPVHVWDGVTDENLPLLRFARVGDRAGEGAVMSNNFAFGGCNVSLILGRMTNGN